jgi:pimeloyl-ACP methyl ester carboxylesterase
MRIPEPRLARAGAEPRPGRGGGPPTRWSHLYAAATEHGPDIHDTDVVGYSMGGGSALQLAIRHPGLVLASDDAVYRNVPGELQV